MSRQGSVVERTDRSPVCRFLRGGPGPGVEGVSHRGATTRTLQTVSTGTSTPRAVVTSLSGRPVSVGRVATP